MLTWKNCKHIRTPLFVSASGCRTSIRNVVVNAGGIYVESDWTTTSARILGKQPVVAIHPGCTAHPVR